MQLLIQTDLSKPIKTIDLCFLFQRHISNHDSIIGLSVYPWDIIIKVLLMAASRGRNKTLTLPLKCINAAEMWKFLGSCPGEQIISKWHPHKAMVRAPPTLSHNYHSTIDFRHISNNCLMQADSEDSIAAFEILLKLGYVLSPV